MQLDSDMLQHDGTITFTVSLMYEVIMKYFPSHFAGYGNIHFECHVMIIEISNTYRHILKKSCFNSHYIRICRITRQLLMAYSSVIAKNKSILQYFKEAIVK